MQNTWQQQVRPNPAINPWGTSTCQVKFMPPGDSQKYSEEILKMEEGSSLGRQGKNKNFGFLKIHLPLPTDVLVLSALQRDLVLA